MRKNIFNTELLKLAKQVVLEKEAFVPGDPTGGAGPGGMPPGGMPPAAGMDPSMAGGAPPAGDPAAAGAPPVDAPPSRDEIQQMIQQAVQQAGGGAAAGPGGKKKVDINTEIYHVKHLLVQLVGMLGGQIDPKVLMGDPAENPHAAPEEAAADPASVAAAPGALQSAIQPIKPIGGASPEMAQGGKTASVRSPGEGLDESQMPVLRDKASALLYLLRTNDRQSA